ncbi:MAG: transcriptional repressor [Chloroflexi bacterium]|nr:transcriptional repressor [Chloroflexota bacterium]
MKEALRKKGVPLTPQRLMILDVLQGSHDHVSAEDIFHEVQKSYPYINISTVFRTLDLLKDLDMVTVTDLGGGCLRYHTVTNSHHHHLICHRCGSTTEIEDSVLEPVRRAIDAGYGFEAQMHHFAIWGLCRECRHTDKEQQ